MRAFARIAALLAVVAILSTVGFYVLGQQVVRPKFERLEREQTQTLAKDARRLVDTAVDNADAVAVQNTQWSGLYDVMTHDAHAYLEAQEGDDAAHSAGLSVAVVAYQDGRIAYENGYDWDLAKSVTQQLVPRDGRLRALPLFRQVFSGRALRGVFVVDGRPVALAARPIERSDASGGRRGIAIFARYFDRRWIAEASAELHTRVSITPIAAGTTVPDERVTDGGGAAVAEAALTNGEGAPVATVTVESSPQIDTLARDTIRTWMIVATLATVLGAAALIVAVQKTSRRQSERFHSLVQKAQDVIILSDRRGVITYASPSALRVFGHEPSALVGTQLDNWVHPDDGFDPQFAAWRAPTTTDPELMLRFRRADGTWALCEGHRANLLREPAVKSMVLNLHDVTERARASDEIVKARDAAVHAMKVKSEFLASMSHEIRTPLNGVLGLTELLLNTELDTEQRQFAATSYSAAQNLLAIVNDILDFSKVEAGKVTVEDAPLDPGAALRQVAALLRPQANAKDLVIIKRIPPDLPTQLRGDPLRLRQVLLNLMSNAIKFTEAGTVTVTVEVLAERDETVSLRFAVTDTGIGIAPQDQERIFGAFAQADSSVTREYGGTGLGLAISRQLVMLMGGELRVSSELGLGSTFSFDLTLPRDREESVAAPEPDDSAASVTVRSGPRSTILVVEDNDVNQLVATRMLAKLGYDVDVVDSGVAALEALTAKEYGLVLMDCQMPVMDGYEATKRLRQREGATGEHRTTVVAMTAAAMEGDRDRCLAAGMDDYITKPVTLAALRDVTHRWCASSSTEEPMSAETAAGDAVPASIDEARLRDLLELDPDGSYVEELITAFVDNAHALVTAMREATGEGDPEALQRAAHTLKGSSASIGATRLADQALALESLGRGRALGQANVLVEEAATELERAAQELRATLTTLASAIDGA